MIISDTTIYVNLLIQVLSSLMALIILILAMIIACGYYYDVKEANAEIKTYLCSSFPFKQTEYCNSLEQPEQPPSELRLLDESTEGSTEREDGDPEVIMKELGDELEDSEDRIKKGKRLNKAGFALVLIDVIIRITEFFLLCCCTRRSRGINRFLNSLIFITFILALIYLICLGVSLNKFKKIKKTNNKIHDLFEDLESLEELKNFSYFSDFVKEVRRTKKILTGIIVLCCLEIPMIIYMCIAGVVCGGFKIVSGGDQNEEQDVQNVQ